MVRSLAVTLALGLMLWSQLPAAGAEEDARQAAHRFGRALTSSRPQDLRSILPSQGKIRLKLLRLGPEDGYFGPGQVEAIFRDFLAEGSVRSFELGRLETDGRSFCLVHARAALSDRQGHPARVRLHLSFQPEASRWVLREIKESRE